MSADRILVLGGTGPSGVCLIRELLHRNLPVVAFARSPEKLPSDVSSNPLLDVVKGELDDKDAVSTAVSQCRIVLSFLGPQIMHRVPPTLFGDFYRNTLLPTMRQHGVRRIIAVSTVSAYAPEDKSSWIRAILATLVKYVGSNAYSNVLAICDAFQDEEATKDIDWTVFRIAMIPGGHDADSWKRDREDGKTYAGPVGGSGWTLSQKRAALARWVADVAESDAPEFIGQLPAVSRLAKS